MCPSSGPSRTSPLPASSPFVQVALIRNLWLAYTNALADAGVCHCLIRLSKNLRPAPGGTSAVSVQRTIKNPASSAGRVRPRRTDLLAARPSFYPVFVTNLTSLSWKPGRRTPAPAQVLRPFASIAKSRLPSSPCNNRLFHVLCKLCKISDPLGPRGFPARSLGLTGLTNSVLGAMGYRLPVGCGATSNTLFSRYRLDLGNRGVPDVVASDTPGTGRLRGRPSSASLRGPGRSSGPWPLREQHTQYLLQMLRA